MLKTEICEFSNKILTIPLAHIEAESINGSLIIGKDDILNF